MKMCKLQRKSIDLEGGDTDAGGQHRSGRCLLKHMQGQSWKPLSLQSLVGPTCEKIAGGEGKEKC